MGGRFEELFSSRAKVLRSSEIRELLKWTQKPDIVSFAGGLPSPQSFPVEEVGEIIQDILRNNAARALQYGTSEGLTELREELANRMRRWGVDRPSDEIIVTHGAQQGIDLLCKVFLDPGDTVVASQPTYLGFRTSLIAFQAHSVGIPVGEDGVDLDLMEESLERLRRKGVRPKFIYVMPTFHNPVGVTMPEAGRKRLVDLAAEYETVIVEDDPYGEIRFEGDDLRALKSYDDDGRVIYLSTFSKILAPGFRLAWAIAPEGLFQKLLLAKQSADLCTNSFGQFVAHEYLARGLVDEQVAKTKALYHGKRDLMLKAMEEHFPEGSTWTKALGGLFSWATMPEGVDTSDSLMKCLENHVAYVPGSAFHTDDGGRRSMRLNFSYPTDAEIVKGIERLGRVMTSEVDKGKGLAAAPA